MGNARTFLWAWLSARSAGGRLVLRVEDLEKRAAAGVLERMLSDLRWLGLDWDEGPVWGGEEESRFRRGEAVEVREEGPHGPYIQSRREGWYREVFGRLREAGLIYPCVCTRREIAAASAPHEGEQGPAYSGTCRGRFASYEEAERECGEGRKPVWRFRVPEGVVVFEDLLFGRCEVDVAGVFGDFVVFKDPGRPAYQLAVVADDIAMAVTEVVRGDDLIPSTGCQILLYRALGREPPVYGHVPLVVGRDGRRLAKRHGDFRLASLREEGVSAEAVVGRLAAWSGLGDGRPCRPEELLEVWGWRRVVRERVVVTEDVFRGGGGSSR